MTEQDEFNARIQRNIRKLRDDIRDADSLRVEVARLKADLAHARAALQAVEWADMERRCPWCLAYADDNIGHKAYCQRQAALGMGEGQ